MRATQWSRRAREAAQTLVLSSAIVVVGCGGGGGDTSSGPATSSGSLQVSLSGSTISLAPGASQTITGTVTRVGSVSGDVTVSVDGMPAGVSVSATPAVLSGSSSSVQLAIAVASATTPGTYSLVVHATAGTTTATAGIALTITPLPSFSVSLSPAALSVRAGGTATSTLTVTRTALDQPIDLSVSNAPSGLTVTTQPASVTATTATISVVASSSVAAGQYSVIVRALPSGFTADRAISTTLAVTVPPSSSSNTAVLSWARCTAPDWVATEDGDAPWTRATLASNNATFTVTANKGSFAYVQSGASVFVRTMTAAELTAQILDMCPAATGTKRITGTDGAPPGPAAGQHNFDLGGAQATILPGGSANFTITGVSDGVQDLVAWVTGTSNADKMLIVRDVNLPDGGSLGSVNLTSEGVAQSLNVATVANALSSESYTFSQYYLTTAACTQNPIGTFSQRAGASTGVIHGVPAGIQRATDFHMVSVVGIGAPTSRSATISYHTAGDVSITMPSAMVAPTVTRLAGAYLRFTAAFSALSGEFDRSIDLAVQSGGHLMDISMSPAAAAGSGLTLTIPDFSAVSGWNNSFAIASGASVTAVVTGVGGNPAGLCTEGARTVSSSNTFAF